MNGARLIVALALGACGSSPAGPPATPGAPAPPGVAPAPAPPSRRTAADFRELAERLGLVQIHRDPAYHGDVFYTYGATASDDDVARGTIIVALDTDNPFFTLYVRRATIDDPSLRTVALERIATALEFCPPGPVNDALREALRTPPASPLETWEVVLGTRDRAGYRDGYDAWLQVENSSLLKQLIAFGPVRGPNGPSFRLECRG